MFWDYSLLGEPVFLFVAYRLPLLTLQLTGGIMIDADEAVKEFPTIGVEYVS
jgi:hypothetical protein